MGFIHDMQVRGGKLYGLVEWNDKGREQVKSGEYRYFSPAIRFNAKHPVTGESIGPVMTSGAMTNSPFLRGMEPLAARDVGNAAGLSRAESMKVHSLDAFLPKMKAALKMNELSSLAECSDQLDRLRDLYEAAPHERAMCQGVNMGDYTDALCSLTEMPVGSNVAQMLDAVQEMIDAAIARHEAAYHEGAEPVENDDEGDDADMRAADAAADTAEGDPTMSAEMLKQLKDTEDKITALTAKFEEQEKAHKVERAELSLALKDSQAKIEKLETELVATKETHAKEKRDARLLEAFETYKDDRKLTDESKEEMALLLDAKPEVFEKRYPRIAADKRHLLRNIASGSKGEKTPIVGGAEAATLCSATWRSRSRDRRASRSVRRRSKPRRSSTRPVARPEPKDLNQTKGASGDSWSSLTRRTADVRTPAKEPNHVRLLPVVDSPEPAGLPRPELRGLRHRRRRGSRARHDQLHR